MADFDVHSSDDDSWERVHLGAEQRLAERAVLIAACQGLLDGGRGGSVGHGNL